MAGKRGSTIARQLTQVESECNVNSMYIGRRAVVSKERAETEMKDLNEYPVEIMRRLFVVMKEQMRNDVIMQVSMMLTTTLMHAENITVHFYKRW